MFAAAAPGRPQTAKVRSRSARHGPNGFNRQFFRTLAVPVERYVFAARGTSTSPTTSVRSSRAPTSRPARSARSSRSRSTRRTSSRWPGRAPIETLVDGVARQSVRPGSDPAVATDTDGDGLRDIGFGAASSNSAPASPRATRDFFRFVAGLEGKLLDDRFNWDLTYNFGQTTERRSRTVNLTCSTAPVRWRPSSTRRPQRPGCMTTLSAPIPPPGQGCVPINVFGVGSITPAAAALCRRRADHADTIQQQVWAANISGSVFELPAGPLGVAIGAEYRKEKSTENWDALTNAGLNAGNALPDTAGSSTSRKLYGEVNIPVLADMHVRSTSSTCAPRAGCRTIRRSGVKTYSLGADYAPIEASASAAPTPGRFARRTSASCSPVRRRPSRPVSTIRASASPRPATGRSWRPLPR